MENNPPNYHFSHSYVTAHRNNIFDNSNINSELTSNDNNNVNMNNNNPNANDIQIDDIFDQLTYAITTEKQNLKSDKDNLNKKRKNFST